LLLIAFNGCAKLTGSKDVSDKVSSEQTVTGGDSTGENVETEILEGSAAKEEVDKSEKPTEDENVKSDTKEAEQPTAVETGKSDTDEEAKKTAEEEKKRIEEEKEAKRLAEEEEAKKRSEEEEKKRIAVKEAKIYDVEIKPLTVRDCLGCHVSQRNRIQENGGKHRLVLCTDCHRSYHSYNPLHDNYSEVMPHCDSCHNDPHGTEAAVLRCLNCHIDPHQPIVSILDPEKLEPNCHICHPDIAKILQEKPSKHTDQKCSSCHSKKHGRIPDCSECHKNHSPLLTLNTSDCLACHPVHSPLEIQYPLSQSKELCLGCHEKPYQDLKEKQTKHSTLTCAKCHPKHGQLMACQDCHGNNVHDARIHRQHQDCGECHSIAHRLEK